MPRSLSRSQIDRLGKRLCQEGRTAIEDLEALQRLRLEYDAPLIRVEQVLRGRLGLACTSRLKTVGTIIDKLKREHTRLSSMHDIAGVRIVLTGSSEKVYDWLGEQEKVVESIRSEFPNSEVIDRRASPSHGYRASRRIRKANSIRTATQQPIISNWATHSGRSRGCYQASVGVHGKG